MYVKKKIEHTLLKKLRNKSVKNRSCSMGYFLIIENIFFDILQYFSYDTLCSVIMIDKV